MTRTITRREILASGLAASGTLAAGVAPSVAAPEVMKRRKRPNVLFIPIDDLNDWTGWLGGYPGVKTPNLDRLARLTTRFHKAYSPSPACQSARAAILFGVEPFNTGVYTNNTGNWVDSPLKNRPSLVRWFREAGYETIGTGKIFHGGWRGNAGDPAANDPKAWSRFEFFSELAEAEGNNVVWGPSGKSNIESEDVARARWLAKDVLSRRHDRPFFASVGIRKPHTPWFVPQEWFDRYPLKNVRYPLGALDRGNLQIGGNEDVRDLPPAGRDMVRQSVDVHRQIVAGKDWRSAVQGYLAAISFADHAVGVALDALLSGPNAADTLICVWSDHGWQLGEKLAWRKFTLWERATHVPLMIGGAGLPAQRSNELISTIDLYPTLATLGVGEAPGGLDGVSFDDHVRGKGPGRREQALSTWTLDVDGKSDKHVAVRTATHRLIQYGNGDRELYDSRADPWEWRNLWARPSKADRKLANDLAEHVPKRFATRVPAAREVEAD